MFTDPVLDTIHSDRKYLVVIVKVNVILSPLLDWSFYYA